MSEDLGKAVLTLDADRGPLDAKMDAAERATSQRLAAMGASMRRAGGKVMGVGRGLTRNLTLPIVAAGGAIGVTGARFETEMQRIVGLVGVSQDQVDQWSKELLRLGPELGKSPRELAEGLFFVTSAGFRGAEAIDVLTTAGKASAAGLGETATIADALTSAINAYGAENLSAAQAGDILTAAVREGKLEASTLAPVLGRLLPTAAAMGVSFDQVAGTLAVFSRTGADAAEGATSLQSIMMTLQKPTKGARDALSEVGLEFEDLRRMAADGPMGLINVMRTLEERFEGNDEALAQIFPNVRAFRGVMNALAQEGAIVDGVMMGVADSSDALDRAFKSAEDTAAHKANVLRAELSAALIQLSDDVLPLAVEVMGHLTDGVRRAIEWWTGLSEETRRYIVIGAGVLAVVGPILIIVGKLIVVLGSLVTAFGWVVKAFLILSKVLLAANVWVLIVVAVALAAILIIRHWDTIVEHLTRAWQWIERTAQRIWTAITAFFRREWDRMKADVSAAWQWIRNALSTAWEAIRNAATSAWRRLRDTTVSAIDGIVTFVRGLPRRAVEALSSFASDMRGVGRNAFQAMRAAVSGRVDALLTLVRGIPGRIVSALGNTGRLLYDAGRAIIQGLIDGILAMFNRLKDTAGRVAGWIKANKGPLPEDRKLLFAEGRAIIEGLRLGMLRELPTLDPLLTGVGPQLRLALPAAAPSRAGASIGSALAIHGDVNLAGADVDVLAARVAQRLALSLR